MAGSASAATPIAPGFVEIGRTPLGFDDAAAGRFAIVDVDNDGLEDFVFTGISSNSALFVVGRLANGSVGFKQMLSFPDRTGIARVLTAKIAGVTHIYTIASDGTARDFTGWPLAEQRQFAVPLNVTAAAIADLYGNGTNTLVVLTPNHVYGYSIDTAVWLWSYSVSGATDMVLAQLDSDAALEIVINASPGLVLDGLTLATDWQYSGGFGSRLATGHLLGDATTQVVGAGDASFSVFRGSPWSLLWSGGTPPGGFPALATADLDHNGRDVILEGDAQWGKIRAYDATTHQQRFQIANPGWGVNAIAAADLDGDQKPEIIFAASEGDGNASIEVVDSATGLIKWAFVPIGFKFSPVALGDLDGDGKSELIVAGNGGSGHDVITIMDAGTGSVKWQSPQFISSPNDPFFISTSRILLIPRDGGGCDIVLAGTSVDDGRLSVIDGITHALKLMIGSYASGPIQSRNAVGVALADFDHDGVQDYILAMQPIATQASGAQLFVFSGADGHLQWTSPVLDPAYANLKNVLVTGPSSDPRSEMIAVMANGMQAFNLQTQVLDWSLLASADAASYIPQGVNGAEIAVSQINGAVTIYDAATHDYLRSFALPAPLNALTAMDGTITNLLVSSGNALMRVDGSSGVVQMQTPLLGADLALGDQLAVVPAPGGAWNIASGNSLGVFRHRLEKIVDRVFATDFESIP